MKTDKNQLCDVFHFDLFGKREVKYKFLDDHSMASIDWRELEVKEPNYFLVKKNFKGREKYEMGFKIDEFFLNYNAGLATEFDNFVIKDSWKEAENLMNDLKSHSSDNIIELYKVDRKKEGKIAKAINDVKKNNPIIVPIDYRPFDTRYTIYTGVSNGIMGRPRDGIMKNMLKNNIALLTCRQQSTFDFQHAFISNKISERCAVSSQTKEVNYVFPIYLYPETISHRTTDQLPERIPNLNRKIVQQIAEKLGLHFTNEKEGIGKIQENASPVCYANSSEVSEDFILYEPPQTFAPIDIIDYIYAVLHSPTYREKYKEFLKIDFPRVPYPTDTTTFWQLVKLGEELREIHLLESPAVEKLITQYPVNGDNMVGKIRFEFITEIIDGDTIISLVPDMDQMKGKVYINDKQYFNNVPEIAWNFYIGGYQPAQKWLKDRKDRELSFEDILHYQKIILALTETDRIMEEIDKVRIDW